MWAVNVAAHPKEFDCNACSMKHCTEETKSPSVLWNIDGDDFKVCPKGLVTHASSEWLRYYAHYMNNILPTSGGLLQQTAKFVKAMELIEMTKAGLNGK